MSRKEDYKKNKFLAGKCQDKKLDFLSDYAPKGNVLDIGSGEGRNSIFLARKGFNVTAIDKIPEGLEKIEKTCKKRKLLIKTVNLKRFRTKRFWPLA